MARHQKHSPELLGSKHTIIPPTHILETYVYDNIMGFVIDTADFLS